MTREAIARRQAELEREFQRLDKLARVAVIDARGDVITGYGAKKEKREGRAVSTEQTGAELLLAKIRQRRS